MPCGYGEDEWEDAPGGDPDAPDEDPQDEDLGGEDDSTDVVACTSCGRAIPDFADRCHHCGEWVIQGGSARPALWIVVTAILAIGVIVALWVS